MIEQDIISDVADMFGITVGNILSKRKIRRYADARTVICYLLRTTQRMGVEEIGDLLNRTHATVVYFNRKAEDWMKMPILNDRGYKAIRKLLVKYGEED